MTAFPNSPRLIKGGIAQLDAQSGAVLQVIPLQYNPDSLTRTMQIKSVGQDSSDHSEALRLKGPPVETFKLDAEVDATDQLEAADSSALQTGLHPALAALELLIYPSSNQLLSNNSLAQAGTLEIAPMETPLVVFIFGPQRIVPVRITEFSVTEEAFDVSLNPIRAKISLGLRVLSVDDLGFSHKGGSLFMSHLQRKEQLAAQAKTGSLSTLGIKGGLQ